MQLLREKFVIQAKKYLGIPYRKRYLTPKDKNYYSPLFLDCCGLVRQVVYDLKDDFGFTLANYNQAYQFDTLPKTLKKEEMQPGDLRFYSAIYFDAEKKPHAHNLTHVEIYLGGNSGEESIAARYRKGVVQIFESYKFSSTLYYLSLIHI
eukprot:TRINITY_DN42073_c0_g1_i1.p1 TRINITY_DN42073_c0_g1~~TRINITY_DN42073_c0_g1_i1.p1  ORF type:complete len:150 (-),score=26.31 TRINITY_DN42073_c0_g1_i1:102-551(-)